MPQFYVIPEDLHYPAFRLAGEESSHLRKVLRARPGDRIKIFDGLGHSWIGIIKEFGRDYAEGVITETLEQKPVHSKITLYFAVPARNAFESIIERCTAAGISIFQPVITERTQLGGFSGAGNEIERRMARIRQIIISSCKQCERADLPLINAPVPYKSALQGAKGIIATFGGISVNEAVKKAVSQPAADSSVPEFSIFVGPEGGFTQSELELAEKAGIVSVSLGNYVLRAEDACFYAALAAINCFN